MESNNISNKAINRSVKKKKWHWEKPNKFNRSLLVEAYVKQNYNKAFQKNTIQEKEWHQEDQKKILTILEEPKRESADKTKSRWNVKFVLKYVMLEMPQ